MHEPHDFQRGLYWLSGLVGAVLVASALIFNPMLIEPDARSTTVYADDIWNYSVPAAYYLSASLTDHTLPLWNALTYCGMPFAANPGNQVFYPPVFVIALLTPGPTAHTLYFALVLLLLAHLALMAASTFGLAREERISRPSAALVSLALVVSVSVIDIGYHILHFTFLLSWTPLILLVILRVVRCRTRNSAQLWGAFGGVAFGFQSLSGFPQLSLIASAGYGLFLAMTLGDRMTTTRSSPPNYSGIAWGFALFGIIGSGITAVMLIPGIELMLHSARSHGGVSESLARTGFDASTQSAWSATRFFWSQSEGASWSLLTSLRRAFIFFCGIPLGAAVLALFGLGHGRGPARWQWPVLSYFFLDCAMGPPFPIISFLGWIAPFRFGSSLYHSVFVAIPVCMLAGFAFDRVLNGSFRTRWRYLGALGGLGLIALLHRHERLEGLSELYAFTAPALIVSIFVLARAPRLSALGIVAALAVEAGVWASTYYSVEPTVPELVANRDRQPEYWPVTDRATHWSSDVVIPNQHLFSSKAIVNGYEPLQLKHISDVLLDESSRGVYARSVAPKQFMGNPWVHTFLKRTFWLVPAVVKQPLPKQTDPFPPTQVVFSTDDGWPERVVRDRSEVAHSFVSPNPTVFELWSSENGAALPEDGAIECGAYMLESAHASIELEVSAATDSTLRLEAIGPYGDVYRGRIEIEGNDSAERQRVEWPLPDVRPLVLRVTLFPGLDAGPVRVFAMRGLVDGRDQQSRIKITHQLTNEVTVRVENTDRPQVLVYVDSYFPGWIAHVDSVESPIFQVDCGFKAVVVPPGTHEVRFEFQSRSVRWGLTISTIAAALAAGVFGVAAIRRIGLRP